MERIGEVIKRVIEQQEQTHQEIRKTDDIDTLWYRIVDARIGEHSYVVKVHNSTLTVRVDSRCYLTEIKRREQELISKIQNYGWRSIKKIECRLG
ncbi:MAG: DciA family protein [Candidatus Ratteibacteria bacterium]|nr:DciA family protein [Candidatus Ratteibacteria bacterium]